MTAWDIQPRNWVCVSQFLFLYVWWKGQARGTRLGTRERARKSLRTKSVPQTAHRAAGVRPGSALPSAPSLEGANQRNLEIPESVFCG